MTKKVKETHIDVLVSGKSQQSAERFSAKMGKAADEVAVLLKALKQIEKTVKGLKSADLFGTNGRANKYIEGQRVRAQSNANRAIFDGTNFGKKLQMLKEEERQANAVLATLDKQNVARVKSQYTLEKSLRVATQLKSIEEVQVHLGAAKQRLAQALQAGDRKRIDQASTLKRRLEEQLGILREQAREAQRQDRARMKAANAPSEKEIATRSRNLTFERLFGDGGAHLFGIQAGLMANYALLNTVRDGFRQAITFSVQLDTELRNLQAITVTTDNNMAQLKDTLIEVSEATKFTALEVTQASVVLGQAGLSIEQIKDALPAVTLLATATGTELSRAVDIATSTLGVFNLEAAQMGHVADVMTASVNQSKLNIEKLTLGLQYSGNIAAQSGVEFEELAASLGAMANAGIRSGSTLGTGTRQVLIALQKPSKAFRETLERLGLTMGDIDIRSKGLYGAFKTLKDAGFTAGDAIKSFEVRAAAAYNALANNLDQVLELQESFGDGAQAAKANETQMRSLSNTSKQFGSILLSVVEIGLQPFLLMLRDVLKASGEFLVMLKNDYPEAIRAVTVALASLGAALVFSAFGKFLGGVARMIGLIKTVKTVAPAAGVAVAAFGAGAARASIGVSLLGRAMGLLGGPIGWVITGVSLAAAAYSALNRESARLNNEVDQLRTTFDNATGEVEEQASKIETLDNKITSLHDRYDMLNQDQRLLESEIRRAKDQFSLMGDQVSETDTTVDGLIETLQELRETLKEEYVIKLRIQQDAMANLIEGQEQQARGLAQNAQSQFTAFSDRWNIGKNTRGSYIPDRLLMDAGVVNNYGSSYGDLRGAAVRNQGALLELRNMTKDRNIDRDEMEYLRELTGNDKLNMGDGLQVALALIEYRKKLAEQIKTQMPVVKELEVSRREAEKLEKEARAETQRNLPQIEVHRREFDGIRSGAGAEMSDVLRNRQNDDPRVVEKELRDVARPYLDRLNEARMVIRANAQIAPDIQEEMLTEVSQIEAAILDGIKNQSAVALEFSKEWNKIQQGKLSGQIAILKGQIKERVGQNRDASGLYDELIALETERAAAQIAEIRSGDDHAMIQDEQIAQVEAKLVSRLTDLAKEEGSVRRNLDKYDSEVILKLLETDLETLTRQMESATTVEKIREIQTRQKAVFQRIQKQRRELLWLNRKPGSEPRDYAADIKALEEQTASGLTGLDDAADSQRNTVIGDVVARIEARRDALIRKTKAEDAELEAQLETAMSEEKVAEITEKRQTIAREAAFRLAQMLNEVEAIGGDTDNDAYAQLVTALKEALRKITDDADDRRDDLNEIAEDAAKEARDKTIETLEADEKAARAAYEAAMDLARAAVNEKDRADALSKALDAAKRILKAGLALVKAESTGNNEADAFKIEELETEFGNRQTDMTRISNKPFPKGGGGGANEEKTTRKNFEARVEYERMNVEQGLTTAGEAVKSIRGTLGDAQTYADGLTGRIQAMRQAAEAGTLSTKEQAELNNLVKERSEILNFIETQETAIYDLLLKQGDVRGASVALLKQWVDENLSLISTFSSGFFDVLNTIKGGFVDLWTSVTEGTKTGKEALRDFALSVLRSLNKVIAELLVVYMLKKALGWLFPGAGITMDMNLSDAFSAAMNIKTGGAVRKATGGEMVPGNLARDSVPALLMPGEFVMRKSAVDMIGADTLSNLNAMGNRRMAKGGAVNLSDKKSNTLATTNVYVVSPEQRPTLGPNDVIAVISEDMARGGQTKKLVKSIQTGAL